MKWRKLLFSGQNDNFGTNMWSFDEFSTFHNKTAAKINSRTDIFGYPV